MRSRALLLSFVPLLFSQVSFAKFEVHEWGTFTSLVGSNGITQDGLYHEDEQLPDFVHPFGVVLSDLFQPAPIIPVVPFPNPPSCQNMKICMDFVRGNVITQKMETPVLYFYTDVTRQVQVNVRFPEGVITETFPAPVATSPRAPEIPAALAPNGNPSDAPLMKLANGNTTFNVQVVPEIYGKLQFVDPSNIYSHARNVASNLVYSGSNATRREVEKFIFYRGLGRFQPKIQITSVGNELQIATPRGFEPQAAFLVDVDENGHSQMIDLGALSATKVKVVSAALIAKLQNHRQPTTLAIMDKESSRRVMIESLVASGLYEDEAVAMLNTWEHGYLRTPGLRLLYTLPRHEVEQVLPLTVTPAPEQLNRVFIGRIEVLLASAEERILNRILTQMESFDVKTLGRMAEPILHRIKEIYLYRQAEVQLAPDPQVLKLLEQLFVQSSTI